MFTLGVDFGTNSVRQDSFGGLAKSADLSHVMKRLLDIKYARRA
jgi:hypothetical protein